MASLSVRQIEDDVYERLRERAKRHGVSMEEEARQIIRQAVDTPERLGTFVAELFAKQGGVELELPPREIHEPLDFSE